MSQMDNAITAIKQLFDKGNRGEQMRELKRNKELFQAARAFYNAIAHFERSAPSKSLEAKERVSAAESITRPAKDGRKFDIPVTYKPKKKKAPSQKPVQTAINLVGVNATSIKGQQNMTVKGRLPLAAATITKPKSGKPKRGRTKCINCGQAFNINHVCPSTSRQPTYTDIKPHTPVKQNTREKDETKRPRRTPFDEGVSGTPIGATKLAGATRQDGRRASTTHAKRFNARFKKGR